MTAEANPPAAAPSAPDPGEGISKGAQIAIGAILIVALLGWFAYSNLAGEASYQYYQNLEEFLAQGQALEGQALRVHGYVSDHSIERNLEAKQVRFAVQNDPPHAGPGSGRTLSVLYLGLETPDMFKDGAEVVLEGRLQSNAEETIFLADNMMAKCPSKFQAEDGKTISEQRSDGVRL